MAKGGTQKGRVHQEQTHGHTQGCPVSTPWPSSLLMNRWPPPRVPGVSLRLQRRPGHRQIRKGAPSLGQVGADGCRPRLRLPWDGRLGQVPHRGPRPTPHLLQGLREHLRHTGPTGGDSQTQTTMAAGLGGTGEASQAPWLSVKTLQLSVHGRTRGSLQEKPQPHARQGDPQDQGPLLFQQLKGSKRRPSGQQDASTGAGGRNHDSHERTTSTTGDHSDPSQ